MGASSGKGRGGRLPDAVRPVRRGGPGATTIIPWYRVLSLSGEHVTAAMLADPAKRDTLNRYNFRITTLIENAARAAHRRRLVTPSRLRSGSRADGLEIARTSGRRQGGRDSAVRIGDGLRARRRGSGAGMRACGKAL